MRVDGEGREGGKSSSCSVMMCPDPSPPPCLFIDFPLTILCTWSMHDVRPCSFACAHFSFKLACICCILALTASGQANACDPGDAGGRGAEGGDGASGVAAWLLAEDEE